jgi:hypothetical protein
MSAINTTEKTVPEIKVGQVWAEIASDRRIFKYEILEAKTDVCAIKIHSPGFSGHLGIVSLYI